MLRTGTRSSNYGPSVPGPIVSTVLIQAGEQNHSIHGGPSWQFTAAQEIKNLSSV